MLSHWHKSEVNGRSNDGIDLMTKTKKHIDDLQGEKHTFDAQMRGLNSEPFY